MSRIRHNGKVFEIDTYLGKRGRYSIKREPAKTSVDFDGKQVLFYTHKGQSTLVQVDNGVLTRRFPGGGIVSFRILEQSGKWTDPLYEMSPQADLWGILEEISGIDDFTVLSGDRQEIAGFLRGIKDKDRLDRDAATLKELTQNVNVMPPDLARFGLDVIVIAVSYGCGSDCRECHFGPHGYREADEGMIDRQIDYYRQNFTTELLKDGVMVLGNQRAGRLGAKLARYRDKINHAFGRNAPLLAFGNVEDAIDIEGVILNIGIESGSPEVRKRYGKDYSNEFIIASCLKMKTFSVNFLTGDERHIEATRALLVDMVRAGVNPETVFVYVSSMAPAPDWYFHKSALQLRDAIRSTGFEVSPYGFFAYSM